MAVLKNIVRGVSSVRSAESVLRGHIKVFGPVPVASYMKECLSNGKDGYYMTRNVFGHDGDFVTSPEISQVFGELVGIHFVNQWQQFPSKHSTVDLIELGPGRGTLMADILKIFNRIPQMSNKVNVHFVEMSPFLAKTQAQTLGVTQPNEEAPTEEGTSVTRQTPAGVNVQWYRKFEDIDIKGFPMIVAHEFLDALPVHQFVYTRDGWRERMIGLDDKDKFQWVLAPSATASSRSLGPSGKYKEGDVYEVSPDSLHTAHQIAQAVKDDGMALIVDYGNKEPKRTPTVRGYKAHVMIEDIVEHEPGEIDLTADVSFQAVAKVCSDTCATYGPMSQGDWLRQMGIHTRTKQMVQSSQTREEQVKIIRSTKRLIDNEGMGSLFQFLSLVPISVDPPFPFVKANSCTAPL